MNRRKFLNLLGIGTVAVIVVPKLLVPEEKYHLITYNLPNGVIFTLAFDERYDNAHWIYKSEWDAEIEYFKGQEIKLRKYLYDSSNSNLYSGSSSLMANR